jgi:hypothetical protein
MAVVVAIVVALVMPLSQLRTVSVVVSCCCPDSTRCHCPDHKAGAVGPSSMRPCHRTVDTYVAQHLPAFAPPLEFSEGEAPQIVNVEPSKLAAPHPSPTLDRPAAPS